MSTTDDETAVEPPTGQLPDAVDREQVFRDRRRYGAYRSLQRLSPINEAAACETLDECRRAIERETYRENPRDWIVARLNDRMEELADAE